ncbi:unnamed protein product [Lactuca virosa]|uniref:Uncharacterized protein n=1 Tax=Lactuca virosa TaxID=75947 RepID=A0AAU9NL70_9ASTR|nr:unnamed protein product [Lactuca virosa]
MITSSLLNSQFLKMQLISNDNPREGSSETKTILNESRSDEGFDNHSSTFEIRTEGIAVEDSESSDANETTNMVTSDQPQYRYALIQKVCNSVFFRKLQSCVVNNFMDVNHVIKKIHILFN